MDDISAEYTEYSEYSEYSENETARKNSAAKATRHLIKKKKR